MREKLHEFATTVLFVISLPLGTAWVARGVVQDSEFFTIGGYVLLFTFVFKVDERLDDARQS